jgi:hypothetical protein
MIAANRATLSGILRTPFFFALLGKGFLAAFITIFASTQRWHHYALVGCSLDPSDSAAPMPKWNC